MNSPPASDCKQCDGSGTVHHYEAGSKCEGHKCDCQRESRYVSGDEKEIATQLTMELVESGENHHEDAFPIVDYAITRLGELGYLRITEPTNTGVAIKELEALIFDTPVLENRGKWIEVFKRISAPEPVSVSLEKCVDALQPFLPQPPLYCDEPNRKLYTDNHIKAAKAVLDAAGVKYAS